MALNSYDFKIIKQAIDSIKKNQKSCNILSLSYPDLTITKKEFTRWFSKKQIKKIKTRKDSINIAALHNNEELINWCSESTSVFEQLGCNLTVIDFTKWQGNELVIDLNHPVDDKFYNKYDLIIDPGTTEHIFNIPQAMRNILSMTKKDGYIYHITPFNVANHGFYSFSPTFYEDFYSNNGGKIINCFLQKQKYSNTDLKLSKTEIININNGNNSILAKKKKTVKNITFPIQTRYKNSISNKQDMRKKYKNFNTIALIPYNGNARHLKKQLKNKDVKIFDDNKILNRYLNIESINNINSEDFDIILITSMTFKKKIKNKLKKLGVSNKKIKLQN